eukprot:1390286-Amorphochlora_amoeboformis.AAC.1
MEVLLSGLLSHLDCSKLMLNFPQIYWEPQKAAFCGVHAVNNLLQGPWYTEWDFSKIALALTEDERKIMAEKGTESKDYLV